jgi:hypothetical protein
MPITPNMPQTIWERFRIGGGFASDKRKSQSLGKLDVTGNRISTRLGNEAFWPTTLDKESDKAARILRSFCSMSPLIGETCDVRESDAHFPFR